MQLSNYVYEDLEIGTSCQFEKTLTEKELVLFAAVSGDVNPVHLDAEFAKNSIFGERIAHGLWSGSLISAALATQLPGPGTIYLSQDLNFKRPVKLGDRLKVNLSVATKDDEKKRVTLECIVTNQDGKEVVSGTAKVIPPGEKLQIEAPELPKISIG